MHTDTHNNNPNTQSF